MIILSLLCGFNHLTVLKIMTDGQPFERGLDGYFEEFLKEQFVGSLYVRHWRASQLVT